MSVLMTTRSNCLPDTADHLAWPPFPAANGKLVQPPVALAAREQRIIAVEFRTADGRCWNAIGGGATVAAAISYARESCPDDAPWDTVSWNDLYGE